jgi:acyl carrier protein
MDDGSPISSPREVIRGIVEGVLKGQGRALPAPDAPLRDAGLTSLGLVNVMLAIEDAFDITFPQEAMTPANFRTMETIEALVASLR